MSENVSLAGCIVSYDATAVEASESNTYIEIPRITDVGEIGLVAEKKDKTVLSDDQMKYGVALQDAPDKQFNGQVIPFNDTGETYETEYQAQQTFFTLCKQKQEMMIKIEWKDGTIDEFLFQPLGFVITAPSATEWKMFNIAGVQNSDVTNTPPTPTP